MPRNGRGGRRLGVAGINRPAQRTRGAVIAARYLPCDSCNGVADVLVRPVGTTEGQFCRPCYDKLAAIWRTQAEKALYLDRRYRAKYQITLEQYGEMFLRQAGRCAICRRTQADNQLVVDHDHETDAVRGLLCSTCNAGLGMFKDSARNLAAAIVYLERDRHEDQQDDQGGRGGLRDVAGDG